MKKHISILLCITLMFAILAGCSSADTSANNDNANQNADAAVTADADTAASAF